MVYVLLAEGFEEVEALIRSIFCAAQAWKPGWSV